MPRNDARSVLRWIKASILSKCNVVCFSPLMGERAMQMINISAVAALAIAPLVKNMHTFRRASFVQAVLLRPILVGSH
jgi:hypothetical protein